MKNERKEGKKEEKKGKGKTEGISVMPRNDIYKCVESYS
jgi:hypothetical protein